MTAPEGAATPAPVAAGSSADEPVPAVPAAGRRADGGDRTGHARERPGQREAGAHRRARWRPDLAANGIPQVALEAYRAAERQLADEEPGCGVSWALLAAIGRVESNHGRYGGSTLLRDGRSDPPIVGIPLDGRPGVARIGDTDGGRYDGDVELRPGGRADAVHPGHLGDVLGGRGLRRAGRPVRPGRRVGGRGALPVRRRRGPADATAGRRDAVYTYNRSEEYVLLVLDLAAEYARGARVDDPAGAGPDAAAVAAGEDADAAAGNGRAATGGERRSAAAEADETRADDRHADHDGARAPRRPPPRRPSTTPSTTPPTTPPTTRRHVHPRADADGDADRVAHGHADRDADDSVADSHGDADGHRDAHADADRVPTLPPCPTP